VRGLLRALLFDAGLAVLVGWFWGLGRRGGWFVVDRVGLVGLVGLVVEVVQGVYGGLLGDWLWFYGLLR
jgi:hypothetical protein